MTKTHSVTEPKVTVLTDCEQRREHGAEEWAPRAADALRDEHEGDL